MPALAPAAGADLRISGPWSLRAEFRAYSTRPPQSGFIASESRWNQWQFTPVAALSLVCSPR